MRIEEVSARADPGVTRERMYDVLVSAMPVVVGPSWLSLCITPYARSVTN